MCVAMLCYMLSLLPMNISFGHLFAFSFKCFSNVQSVWFCITSFQGYAVCTSHVIYMCISHKYVHQPYIYVQQPYYVRLSYICAAACRNAVPLNTCRSHFPRVDTQSAAMFHFFWRLYLIHLKTIHRSKCGCNILLFIFTHVKVLLYVM